MSFFELVVPITRSDHPMTVAHVCSDTLTEIRTLCRTSLLTVEDDGRARWTPADSDEYGSLSVEDDAEGTVDPAARGSS